MSSDLGLPDQKDAVDFLDNTLRPAIKSVQDIKPRMLFLVASSDQIIQMLENGWNEPHFHFNPMLGTVSYDRNVPLQANGQTDDIIFPFATDDKKVTTAQRQADLETMVQLTETKLEGTIADNVPGILYQGFQGFAFQKGLEPLHLRLDEQWFSLGVMEVLSCKYTGDLWGVPRQDLIAAAIRPRPDNPIAPSRIDALNPISPKDIRASELPAYIDALTRKSAAAVNTLVTGGKEDAIGKVIAQMRATAPTTGTSTQPADGVALVAMIKSMSGIDLTDALSR
jgi:hypothetical protein